MFLILCYTGIRFSDLGNLKPENIDIEKGIITLYQIKTDQPIRIGIIDRLKVVLGRFPNLAIPRISNQKFNDYLKKLGKLVGLSELRQIVTFSGKNREVVSLPKYKLLGSHVGRRTYVTLSHKKGVLLKDIALTTGHKKLSTIEKYVKVNEDAAIKAIKQAWN